VDNASPRLVVIGNGMAGVAVVEAILKTKKPFSITLFGDEAYTNYNRIYLSDVLAGKTDFEKIILNKREWYDQNQIDLKMGVKVTAIDPPSHSIAASDGSSTPYDYLVIAVGAIPFIPPIKGYSKKSAYVFRTIEDTQNIVAAASPHRHAVVVGGGLLGLEAARGLINYGASVTVVHLTDRLMEQQLDPTGAAILKRKIEQMGIQVHLNTTAVEILGEKTVSSVRLTRGETIAADMVILTAGVKPDVALAADAGFAVGRGILVDDRMETSIPGIFAVGDVIEHRGKTYGLVAPLMEQAAVVADTLAGEGKKRYEGTVCAVTLKVAGIALTSAGDFLGGNGVDELVFVDTEKGIYKKMVIRKNRLIGFILLGDNKDGRRLFNLIQKGEEITPVIKAGLLGNVSTEGGDAGGATRSGVEEMADTEMVCNCNNVTKGTILCAIREKGLKTREQVAVCTEATTGCGSCAQWVDDLLSMGRPKPPIAGMPMMATLPLIERAATSLKTVDLEKVKQAGLGINFERLKEMGARALTIEDHYRLKTYGFCAQKHEGYFMLRIRVPGGILSAAQVAALSDLSKTYGAGWGHVTVRQSLELHWVRVEDALDLFAKLELLGLTTRSACGHTMRNVAACPHGTILNGTGVDAQFWAQTITDYFVKRSDLINPTMPNRLNLFFSACPECDAHAAINDLTFMARERSDETGKREIGFEVWVGGSLGAHPMPGFQLKLFVSFTDVLPICQALFTIHTQYGNRNKAKSRLKYLIEKWGQDKFVAMFEKIFLEKKGMAENLSVPLPDHLKKDKRPVWVTRILPGLVASDRGTPLQGIVRQRQRGYVSLTVEIPLGEIRSEQLRALGQIAAQDGNGFVHFTQDQNVEFHWVPVYKIKGVVARLKQADLFLKGEKGWPKVLACPGTEFCPLAVTNALGAGRDIYKFIQDARKEKADLLRSLSIHISGCPNSCAKHQVADIGLAGTMAPMGDSRFYSYQLFLGGRLAGGIRLGEMVRKGITEAMLVPTVALLLDEVLEQREAGERFQDTVDRLTPKNVVERLEGRLATHVPEVMKMIEMVPYLKEGAV